MTVLSRLRKAGFEVYAREQWGSRQTDAYAERARNRYYQLPMRLPYHFLHITVTRDTDRIREGKAGARQVETYGYTEPPMVSYQMLVTNEGRAFEGQNYGVKGTHTVNDKKLSGFPEDLNRQGYAVALMQNVEDEVTDAQVVLVAACMAAAELEGYVRIGAPIYPHRMFAWKGCPGDLAVARLDQITHLKNQLVAAGLPAGSNRIGTSEEDTLSWNEEFAKWAPRGDKKGDKLRAAVQLNQARGFAEEAYRSSVRCEAAVRALGKALGPEVEKAVEQALKDAAVDVDITVTTKEKP